MHNPVQEEVTQATFLPTTTGRRTNLTVIMDNSRMAYQHQHRLCENRTACICRHHPRH